ADRGVRDPREPARLEDGEPGGHERLAAAGILDAHALSPADVLPSRTGRQHERDGAEIAPEDHAGHSPQHRALLRARQPGLADHGLNEAGLARSPVHLLTRGGEAAQRQDRYEQESTEERPAEPRIPGPEPEPEVQAGAAVDPGHRESDDLAQARNGIELPDRQH